MVLTGRPVKAPLELVFWNTSPLVSRASLIEAISCQGILDYSPKVRTQNKRYFSLTPPLFCILWYEYLLTTPPINHKALLASCYSSLRCLPCHKCFREILGNLYFLLLYPLTNFYVEPFGFIRVLSEVAIIHLFPMILCSLIKKFGNFGGSRILMFAALSPRLPEAGEITTRY